MQLGEVLVVGPVALTGLAAREELQAGHHPTLLPLPLQEGLLAGAFPVATVGRILVASSLR